MTGQKKRVLVVDDVQDWRITIIGLLEDEGFAAKSAATATEALELFEAERWDLAVVDIRLNERDITNTEGLDLAVKFKTKRPDFPVVMITGYSSQDYVEQALKRKLAADFVEKDSTEELLERISKVLA